MPLKKKTPKPDILLDEKTHHYTVGGERRPSTTQIINIADKFALTQWKMRKVAEYIVAAIPEFVAGDRECSPEELDALLGEATNAPNDIAGDAAAHGTTVHKLIQMYLAANRKPRTGKPEVHRDLEGFARWKRRHTVVPEALEKLFYHSRFEYCCRPDYVGDLDGRRVVLDWKTGGFHRLPVGMQLAANAAAVEDMTGRGVDGIAAIHIDDRGLPHWRNFTEDRERYWQKFVALLNYWKL